MSCRPGVGYLAPSPLSLQNWALRTSSSSAWDLVSSAAFQARPRPTESEAGVGPSFPESSGDSCEKPASDQASKGPLIPYVD